NVASTSGFNVGDTVMITTGGNNYTVHITIKTSTKLTWDTSIPVPVNGDRIAQLSFATNDGTYPAVWTNEAVDPSFGITSPVFLDQLKPDGTFVSTIVIDPAQLVTSFPSKSELGLNLSPDGSVLTFMGYRAAVNSIDVSNSNTPGHSDPTDPVSSTF